MYNGRGILTIAITFLMCSMALMDESMEQLVLVGDGQKTAD
jgi:hypothetical protein